MITTKIISLSVSGEMQDEEFLDENRDMHHRIAKALEVYKIQTLAINRNIGGKFIDILGVDDKKSLVIVECKTGQERGLFVQVMSYYKIVCDNIELVEEACEEKGFEIDFDRPIRLIGIAHKFEDHEINCYEVLRGEVSQESFTLEPVLYRWYRESNQILLTPLNPLEESTKKTRSTAVKISKDECTLEQHIERGNEEVQNLFKKLQKMMFGLGSDVEEATRSRYYINYRIRERSNFAYVVIQGSKIKMNLRGEMDDPQKKLRDVSEIGNWGSCKWELIVYPDSDLDYVSKLITQGYESIK